MRLPNRPNRNGEDDRDHPDNYYVDHNEVPVINRQSLMGLLIVMLRDVNRIRSGRPGFLSNFSHIGYRYMYLMMRGLGEFPRILPSNPFFYREIYDLYFFLYLTDLNISSFANFTFERLTTLNRDDASPLYS
jgi:hypothetical protein